MLHATFRKISKKIMKEGYPAINVKFADRRRYYDCFTAYHESKGNPDAMIQMVSEYVVEAVERYLDIVGF